MSSPTGVRFAPSPTGRFHVGNLRTAWISHEWARAWGEPWVVRFEDIDAPRVLAGARESQLADMAALGLKPAQELTQSASHGRHRETFERAAREGRVYPCLCSRKEVREALERSASAPHPAPGGGGLGFPSAYSGHCRALSREARCSAAHALPSLAWRFAVDEDESGRSDFIVARTGPALDAHGLPADPASFVPAYHWACAVDDLDGGYRLLVRAADLTEVVPQHRAIMAWLAASERMIPAFPAVFHTALITQSDGHRLEKRTRGVTLAELAAAGVSPERLVEQLRRTWDPRHIAEWEPGKVFGEARTTLKLKEVAPTFW